MRDEFFVVCFVCLALHAVGNADNDHIVRFTKKHGFDNKGHLFDAEGRMVNVRTHTSLRFEPTNCILDPKAFSIKFG
jgi:hypothetical protein